MCLSVPIFSCSRCVSAERRLLLFVYFVARSVVMSEISVGFFLVRPRISFIFWGFFLGFFCFFSFFFF